MNRTLRNWLIAGAATVICILFSIRFLDHPIADFVELHFRHTEAWRDLSLGLTPIVAVALAALFFLFWAGASCLAKRPLASWAEMLLTLAWAEIWALATEFVFKHIFGRAWPDPTYIHGHMDGFRFFHAGDGWMAFPSGHALSSFALAAVFWFSVARWRVSALLAAAIVSFCMVLCNYHWLSDVIAGAFMGWTIGWMTLLIFTRRI